MPLACSMTGRVAAILRRSCNSVRRRSEARHDVTTGHGHPRLFRVRGPSSS